MNYIEDKTQQSDAYYAQYDRLENYGSGHVPKIPYVWMGNRTMLWHEAGHAVVAMHFGVKVKYYGLDPLPHCLVKQGRLNNHQKGVLLCAGAAMTKVICGREYGGEASDYPMAKALGDLEVFKKEALILCYMLVSQAKYLVEARLGRLDYSLNPPEIAETITPNLKVGDAHYDECVKAGKGAELGQYGKRAVRAFAKFQMKYPDFVAKYLKV